MFFSRYSKVLLLLAVMTQTALCSDSFDSNPHYLLAPIKADRELWLKQANAYRQKNRVVIEERKDLAWMSSNFTCRMCMMFDSELLNPDTGEYLIDSLLADGEKEFGGYDSIILWHAYPRLGVDERNQFDTYRQMPGGLEGIKKAVEKCQKKNVKVFIDYNPWDTGTRREDKDDFKCLAQIVSEINADGVFLDILSAADPNLRKELDNVRNGIAIASEGVPEIEQLSLCSGSWAQWLNEPNEPGILKLKWLQPRHMQYQIRRWDRDRSDEIETAFFNGSGMLVWENIFGSFNPWNTTDRYNWKKANLILHFFSDEFAQTFEPFYPTLQKKLFTTRWSNKGKEIIVLLNRGKTISNKLLFEINSQPDRLYFDLWNGTKIELRINGHTARISGSIDKIGCILIIHKSQADDKLRHLLDEMKIKETKIDSRNSSKDTTYADKVCRTAVTDKTAKPEGMVFVPATKFTMEIEHIRRECGCYPDPGKKTEGFGYGLPFGAVYPYVIHQPIKHRIGPMKIKPFFIDETEVTNAQYKKFLKSSGYKPKFSENFLKHWPNGQMPENLADHPVVFVDIDDARAYAKWAGKRLPTEEEWQLAAQSTDGRKWPWGNEFDPNKCNSTGTNTLPVKSHPEGKSPYGCYNMSGNVWEWTESCRDDGHTRFVMIRGGSYFNAKGSIWYVNGGPQPCGHHIKFIRIWQGLDRCSTIGFRCVVDSK
ncbi:MAG: SUMF1/EgtB/PvdO family nonheme iron enzyme [Sedimentisphaerales bacterium]